MSLIGRLYMDLRSSDIYGEAEDAEYRGQIELDSWDWGVTRKMQKAGEKEWDHGPGEFNFTKNMDKSSMLMLNRLTTKKAVAVKVTLVEASDRPFKLVVDLKRAFVTKYSVDGKDEEKMGKVEETWTMSYDEISFSHVPEPVKGATSGAITSSPAKRSPKQVSGKTDAKEKLLTSWEPLSEREKKDAVEAMKKKTSKLPPHW